MLKPMNVWVIAEIAVQEILFNNDQFRDQWGGNPKTAHV